MTWLHLLLGSFILFAYTAEAMTGFGSIVIALSLGALFFPIEWLQTVLVPLNICMTGFLTWRHRRLIDWVLLRRLILPLMVLGTIAGNWMQPFLGGPVLKAVFALLILWFALRALWQARGGAAEQARPLWQSRLLIGGAGITHGLFASGGPLLVYGLSGMALDKARFRATLILVWFGLNSLLTLIFLAQGRLQPEILWVGAYLPLIPLGVWLGERLHHKVDEAGFRLWLYRVLVLAAVGLLISALR